MAVSLILAVVCCLCFFCNPVKAQSNASGWELQEKLRQENIRLVEETREKILVAKTKDAMDVLLYFYPIVMYNMAQKVATKEDSIGNETLFNVFQKKEYKFFKNENVIINELFFDITNEPHVFCYPEMGDRMYMFEIFDPYARQVRFASSFDKGGLNEAGCIVFTEYNKDIFQDQINGKINNYSILRLTKLKGLLRVTIQIKDKEDELTAKRLQSQLEFFPTSNIESRASLSIRQLSPEQFWLGKSIGPKELVNSMSPQEFFDTAIESIKYAPVDDADVLEKMLHLGLLTRRDRSYLTYEKIRDDTKMAIDNGLQASRYEIERFNKKNLLKFANGWIYYKTGISSKKPTNLEIAAISTEVFSPSREENFAQFTSFVDVENNPYNGNQRYIFHLTKEQLPIVRSGFWSVMIYNKQGIPLDATKGANSLVSSLANYNSDGSLTIAFCNQKTCLKNESNVLLTSEKDEFVLVLRLYPAHDVVQNKWFPQPVYPL